MEERTQQPYNDQAIKSLTRQVKDLLQDIVTDRAEIREQELVVEAKPLAVWVLRTDDLGSDLPKNIDLRKLAKDTKRWHHQIRIGTNFFAYARSAKPTDASVTKKQGPTDVSLTKLSVSPLATKIHAALEQHKEEIKTEVRLLTVPASNVNALWWGDGVESKVIVLPGRFTKVPRGKLDKPLDLQKFLKFVLDQPRVGGINRNHD